jgi:3-deoxy-D-manno-octulosonate 8-phosphate phosphatase (KDO 8-P phosphatase)
MKIPNEILKKAKKIKLLLLDVDGVLTDGKIIISEKGEEIKHFNVLDGLGIKLLQKIGVEVGIISSRESKALQKRAEELGIKLIFQGKLKKVKIYEEVLKTLKLKDEEVAYVGDDLVDIPVLKRVGLAVGVPNARAPVNEFVHYVTQLKGGEGAVREICEIIIKAKDKWEEILKYFY